MPGATIDHMISVTILITAMLVAMVTFSNMFASAIAYERNRQVAMKAGDLIDTTCLAPGNPAGWSKTDVSITAFGLQDSNSKSYSLSPFSPMRLRTSQESQYDGTTYTNLSLSHGGYVHIPVDNCVSYSRAAELLGVNGTYGFEIDLSPTLDVNITEVNPSLELQVEARGPGLPLAGATLNYYLFHIDSEGTFPSIVTYPQDAPGVDYLNQSGSASISFPLDSTDAYFFVVYVHLSGLNGVGYYSRNISESSPAPILPFIQNFEDGDVEVKIANNSPSDPVKYNATFFALSHSLRLQRVQLENSTDELEYGTYNTTKIQASETGILLISYQHGEDIGSVVMPWGIGALGVSVTFGGNSTGYSFVATELRQVRINEVSYQMMLSAWRLNG